MLELDSIVKKFEGFAEQADGLIVEKSEIIPSMCNSGWYSIFAVLSKRYTLHVAILMH